MESNHLIVKKRHRILERFLNRWPLKAIDEMSIDDYNKLDNKDSFCYWIEHIADDLGRIKGSYSNMFGIWEMKVVKSGTSEDFIDDGKYKWYKKYGKTADEAFKTIKYHVYKIAESAVKGQYDDIDGIDYFSLVKWKIAFIYSDFKLFPVYKKVAIRQIAKNFGYVNYTNSRLSSIHTFMAKQKPQEEDLFEFAFRQYRIAEAKQKHNYYLIGSKYRDSQNNYYDISPLMYKQNVIATGFFWDDDLSHLYGQSTSTIHKWLDKNLKQAYPDKYDTAKQIISMFLNIKEGDIIAVKSKGQFNSLTIIAYAEVTKVEGRTYFHDDTGQLGHCLHVNYYERGFTREVGLNYAQTLHKIIPNQKVGHFEKIFDSYALAEESEHLEDEADDQFELSESMISEKQTESVNRDVSYSTTVRHVHNKIQSAFAKHLQKLYPNDSIQTEYKFIDIVRQSSSELFYYEVKPYSIAYNCIRAAIGQLLDYYHTNKHKSKQVHLVVVGPGEVKDTDSAFIQFIKAKLNISFEYIQFSV